MGKSHRKRTGRAEGAAASSSSAFAAGSQTQPQQYMQWPAMQPQMTPQMFSPSYPNVMMGGSQAGGIMGGSQGGMMLGNGPALAQSQHNGAQDAETDRKRKHDADDGQDDSSSDTSSLDVPRPVMVDVDAIPRSCTLIRTLPRATGQHYDMNVLSRVRRTP